VKEYWIVDAKKRRVEIYNNVDHQFKLNQRIEPEGSVKSLVIEGFEINQEDIFSLE
jgi:Uma2 family endonuclease